MEKEEFLKYFNKLNHKDRFKLILVYRRKTYCWNDVYFQILRRKKPVLLKAAEKKGFINKLIEDAGRD